MIHHGYFRSSSSYRLRIAFNLKGVAPDYRSVHLLRDGGQQKTQAYRALNPQGLVPALEVDGDVLTQSPAILEWIEETWPTPALLPADPIERAKVRAFCAVIGCDIHPLQNLRVIQWLKAEGKDPAPWLHQWIGDGLAACEALIADRTTAFAFGDAPGMAEVYLMPQMFSAERFGVDLTAMPRLRAIAENCAGIEAIAQAHPSNQPDAE